MINSLVSLIITTYNKKKYIGKCLESVTNQDSNLLQVIIVDDGSTDGTKEICSHFVDKNDNFELHVQKNAGVSSARNTGLSYAYGEYIMFLDGDDYLSENYIEEVVSKFDSDFLLTGYTTIDSGMKTNNKLMEKNILGLDSVRNSIFNNKIFPFFSVPWAKLFKRSIIKENNLLFDGQSYGEDTIFVMQYLKYVDELQLIDSCGYNNVIINNTLSRKEIVDMWPQLKNVLKASNDSFNFKYSREWTFLYIRNIKLMLLNSNKSYKRFVVTFNLIQHDEYFEKINKKYIESKKDYVLLHLLKYNQKYLLFLIIKLI